MIYIKEPFVYKQIIDRSEFIALIYPIESTQDIPDILKTIKNKYPKATHYVTAYMTKDAQGSSDDGEPSGTSGMPSLDALRIYDMMNVFVCVVRYFGGIKLGPGGLIRAYKSSVIEVLKVANLFKEVTTNNYSITFSYDLIHFVDTNFNDYIINKSFEDNVTYDLQFIEENDLLEKNKHLFKEIKNHGIKNILIPWK